MNDDNLYIKKIKELVEVIKEKDRIINILWEYTDDFDFAEIQRKLEEEE
jgi:hypothetical protein